MNCNSENEKCDVVLIGFEDQENLGLRSISAYLIQQGIKVKILPCRYSSKNEILENLRALEPSLVGFSLIFQRMLPYFVDLIDFLREQNIKSHFTIGGHYPTFESKNLLNSIPGLDSVVRHEGEYTTLELLRNLSSPESWRNIKGIAYRFDGKVIVTPPRPLIDDLDSLPWITRPITPTTHRGIGLCSIASSRGCYYNCSFCSIQEFYSEPFGPKRRSRSPKNVADEMMCLFQDQGVRIFIFQDDDMFMKANKHKEWIRKFVQEIKSRGISNEILLRISCRIDDLDQNLLDLLKSIGLFSVYIGIESGSNQGLKTFNKLYTVKDVYRGLEILEEVNLPFEFGFMLLEPDSTIKTVRENIEFLRYIASTSDALVNFCKMSPYAGTPIATKLIAENRLKGSTSSPEYDFIDSRLNYLQLFISRTFNFRNFSDKGLVERLRFAKFDLYVLEKFFPNKFITDQYYKELKDLIRQTNESAVQTMSMAISFIEKSDEKNILNGWSILEELSQEEKLTQFSLNKKLEYLTAEYKSEEIYQQVT